MKNLKKKLVVLIQSQNDPLDKFVVNNQQNIILRSNLEKNETSN